MMTEYPENSVWTNGCFDVLHVGHIRLLSECAREAKERGATLVVGIDSDNLVRERKGPDRPVNNHVDRAEVLLSVKGVQLVIMFDTHEDLVDTLRTLRPQLMIVGVEHRGKVVGGEFAKEVRYFDRVPGYSTSRLIGDTK